MPDEWHSFLSTYRENKYRWCQFVKFSLCYVRFWLKCKFRQINVFVAENCKITFLSKSFEIRAKIIGKLTPPSRYFLTLSKFLTMTLTRKTHVEATNQHFWKFTFNLCGAKWKNKFYFSSHQTHFFSSTKVSRVVPGSNWDLQILTPLPTSTRKFFPSPFVKNFLLLLLA